MTNPTTRKYPRTLEQAFGPHTGRQIASPGRMDWQDVVVIAGCLAVVLAVMLIAFWP